MENDKNKNLLGVAEDLIRTKFVIIIFARPTFGASYTVNWTVSMCRPAYVNWLGMRITKLSRPKTRLTLDLDK